jgi:mRNA-degrading endonuclease RelE of RelBE toxin-antitoxin system
MKPTDPFEVRLARSAARTFESLPTDVKDRMRRSLLEVAATAARGERVGGKRSKTIQGQADTFHRLRVGDHRVMYDVIPEERVVLVLGIVDRKDLERWLRNR